jgi:nucleotide-binding universal stress UspA family protein
LEVIRKRLQRFCEIVEEKNSLACVNLVTKTVVEVGYPAEEILKAADEEGCDLIVLGSHGKGFLQHAFLGSVSRSVLERARKPVLSIPLPSERTSIWDEM